MDAWVKVDGAAEGEEFDLEGQLASGEEMPASYFVGQELDWEAPWDPVDLVVELPYWLMVPNCTLTVSVEGCDFQVQLRDDCFEVHLGEFTDSRNRRIYIGPLSSELDEQLLHLPSDAGPVRRKCKTVVRLLTRSNADVLAAAAEGGRRGRVSMYYLESLCAAHLPVLNELVRGYRVATYDFFPFELSPWDVPVWSVIDQHGSTSTVRLMDYRGWDGKPLVGGRGHPMIPMMLITPSDLQSAVGGPSTPGELEMLDALNLVQRGDYSGAVRRVSTSIEVILEAVLRVELSGRHSDDEVREKLEQSKNDVPGRLRQYIKLSRRTAPAGLLAELDRTRALRHAVVHDGLRIPYPDRGVVERAVETGRWLFNWFENDVTRAQRREGLLGLRSLGRHLPLYGARITPNGVVVASGARDDALGSEAS